MFLSDRSQDGHRRTGRAFPIKVHARNVVSPQRSPWERQAADPRGQRQLSAAPDRARHHRAGGSQPLARAHPPAASALAVAVWCGQGGPGLWRAYVRRFDQEHTFRFLKGSLNWTLPRVRYPVQADRWTWLVLLAYTCLRLARPLVADQRLPWERPREPGHLTPYRVRRAVSGLLRCLATPATPPKPCGRSPGRPKGARSGPARRYPAIKRTA